MKMQWRLGFPEKSCFGEMHNCSFDGNGYNGAGIDCLYRKCMVLVRAYGTDKPEIILTEIPAVYGTAVASMILGIALLAYFKMR